MGRPHLLSFAIGGRAVENAGSQNPHPRDWRVLYRSAVLETNNSEIAKRLSDAKEAIAEHMRELFRETGVDVDG